MTEKGRKAKEQHPKKEKMKRARWRIEKTFAVMMETINGTLW